jgi:hypothetical protein
MSTRAGWNWDHERMLWLALTLSVLEGIGR